MATRESDFWGNTLLALRSRVVGIQFARPQGFAGRVMLNNGDDGPSRTSKPGAAMSPPSSFTSLRGSRLTAGNEKSRSRGARGTIPRIGSRRPRVAGFTPKGGTLPDGTRSEMLQSIREMQADGASFKQLRSYVYAELEAHGVTDPRPGVLLDIRA